VEPVPFNLPMSGDATDSSRAQVWLESLGDWAWPGRPIGDRPAPAEALPQLPAWLPAFPTRLEPALAGPGRPQPIARHTHTRPLRLLIALLGAAAVSACCALALEGSFTLQPVLGTGAPRAAPVMRAAGYSPSASQPLPTLVAVSQDSAGSSIDRASFVSAALAGLGSFIVYLPPGFASTNHHYPVLYLLHGRDGHASAFLEIGIQRSLDRLIGDGAIPPMLVVMVQDRSGLNNWQDIGTRHSGSYVVEVQQLIDQMLPTIPARAARAIAGSSMGGFGAMHVALANPYRFAVVESWLGFFDNLDAELRADRPIISHVGLYAFLYGAADDPVAVPEENPAFAARLRATGAHARSAIFPGGHSLQKVREHLDAGLLFAGRSLAAAQRRAAAEAAQAQPRLSPR
jgi:enterochelin esterase-like enzyme